MADFYDEITQEQQNFIRRQHMFFVATAPPEGRINLSPKGMDTFRVLDAHTVAYLDLTGSGIETAAHLENDGRVTFMFCSFDQKPNILRLYGTGDVVRPGHPDWDALFTHFDPIPGMRHIIRARIASTQDSCGYAVPRMDFVKERQTLAKLWEQRGEAAVAERVANATQSIDGLPVSTA